MFFHPASNTYVNEGVAFTIDDVQYPANWLNLSTPEDKAALGLVEVVTVGTREDERYFYVSEELVGAELRIVNVPKSPEQIAQMEKAQVQAQIDALEFNAMLPRVTREFMLTAFAAQAAAAGVDPMTNFGYKKVKELDDQIAALRAKL